MVEKELLVIVLEVLASLLVMVAAILCLCYCCHQSRKEELRPGTIGCGFDPKKKVIFKVDGKLVHEIVCGSEDFTEPMYPAVALVNK